MAEIPALRSLLTPIKCNFTHVKKGNKRSFTHYIRYLQNKHSLSSFETAHSFIAHLCT